MGRTAREVLLLSGALACAACSSPSESTPTDAGEDAAFRPDWCKPSLAAGATATVNVGEGMTFFREIPDGTVLEWEKGPQGGHHVWIAVRQRGLRQRGTILTIDLEDVEDPSKPILVNHSRVIYDFDKDEGYDPNLGGWCARPGLRMQLDNAGGVTLDQLWNHKIKVSVALKDPDGATATGTRVIVVKGIID